MWRLVLILLFCGLTAEGQTGQGKFFIHFTDKNGSPFSITNPSDFLSQKAISRRIRQGIVIDESDIPVNPAYIDSVQSLGAIVFTKSKWFNGITIQCDSSVLSAVNALPFVSSAVKVYKLSAPKIHKEITNGLPANTPSILKTSGTSEGYGGSFNQIHLMNGDFLSENNYKGQGMLIAVLDDGFYSVDQLSVFSKTMNENRIIATWDFVNNEPSVFEDDTHGMMVLSTITGYAPGELIGTAPEASFFLLRSEDANSENIIEEYNWNAAAEFADSAGADVITSSLGYTEFDDASTSHTYADMDGNHCPSSIAADYAVSKGMLVMTSAGNSGNNSWHYIGAPSDGDSVISVGAVDSMGVKAYFSSFGPASDGNIKPNVCAKGYKSTIANSSGGISVGSGTSFACPILAGSATCLWQKFPLKSALQIKTAIERSASISLTPNDSIGYGIPDFRIASYLLSTGNDELPGNNEILGVYPNPFSESLHVRFFSVTNQEVNVELFNEIGQIVYRKNHSVKGGYINTLDLNTGEGISKGIYFLRINTSEESLVKTVIKQ